MFRGSAPLRPGYLRVLGAGPDKGALPDGEALAIGPNRGGEENGRLKVKWGKVSPILDSFFHLGIFWGQLDWRIGG